MFRKTLITLGAATAALGLVASAAAIPTGSKKSLQIDLHCEGGSSYTVVVNGGAFSPGHIVPGPSKFIPVSIETTATYTPPGGGDPIVESDSLLRGGAPRNAEILSCDFEFGFPDSGNGESLSVVGTVEGYVNR